VQSVSTMLNLELQGKTVGASKEKGSKRALKIWGNCKKTSNLTGLLRKKGSCSNGRKKKNRMQVPKVIAREGAHGRTHRSHPRPKKKKGRNDPTEAAEKLGMKECKFSTTGDIARLREKR